MKNLNMTKKEQGLLKGAIRRIFSRSEIRRRVLATVSIEHYDANRPRVKKWSLCPNCKLKTPSYQMQLDHVEPVIHLGESLDDITWDELVTRIWCSEDNLEPLCLTCHRIKSKLENSQRRKIKKEKKDKK